MNLHFHQFGKKHWSYVDCNEVLWLVKHARLLQSMDPATLRPSEFEKLFVSERGLSLMMLMHAIMLAEEQHSVERDRLHVVRRLRTEMLRNQVDHMISGRDIEAMGIEPGPHYRELLAHARDLQLSSPNTSKEELLHAVMKAHHS